MAYMKSKKDYQFTYTSGTAGSIALGGQGSELYLVAKGTGCYWDLGVAASACTAGTATYLPNDAPILIPVQAPTLISALGTGSGTLFIVEFI